MSANDTGKRLVVLDESLLDFAIENCEANIRMSMNFLQKIHDGELEMSRESGQKIVDMIEKFRRLKKTMEDAR